MIKDPLKKPLAVDIGNNSELAAVIKRLIPTEVAAGMVPIVLSPASWPKRVSDATDGAICQVCQGRCWISPSSLNSKMLLAPVCVLCLANEVNKKG